MDTSKIPNYNEINTIIQSTAEKYFSDNASLLNSAPSQRVSWLVASAPFIAGSQRPARWAATNLGTFFNAKLNPQFFLADAQDDLASRLKPVLQSAGVANQTAMKKIELLLQYILLLSYLGDKADDAQSGHFNPLNDSMDFDAEKARIRQEVDACGAIEAVDAIVTFDELEGEETSGLREFWWNP